MATSILDDIKKVLGIEEDETAFDVDVIMHINSTLFNLNQIGVGPVDGFVITGSDETWDMLLASSKKLEAAKSYVYIKCKLVFDPPANSFVLDALNRQAEEWFVRLQMEVEPKLPPPLIVETEEGCWNGY